MHVLYATNSLLSRRRNGECKRAGGCKRRMHVGNVVCAQKQIPREQQCDRASQFRDPLGTRSSRLGASLGEWAAPIRPFEEAWNKGAGTRDKGARPDVANVCGNAKRRVDAKRGCMMNVKYVRNAPRVDAKLKNTKSIKMGPN